MQTEQLKNQNIGAESSGEKTKPAMEVRDVHFSYGKNKILKGASLNIEKGKIIPETE